MIYYTKYNLTTVSCIPKYVIAPVVWVCRPFENRPCCARDPKYWRRLAVAQHMLGYVKGEHSRDVLVNYLRQANETAYLAIRMGANDSDTFTWCAHSYSHQQCSSLCFVQQLVRIGTRTSTRRTGVIDGLLGESSYDQKVQLATAYRLKVHVMYDCTILVL